MVLKYFSVWISYVRSVPVVVSALNKSGFIWSPSVGVEAVAREHVVVALASIVRMGEIGVIKKPHSVTVAGLALLSMLGEYMKNVDARQAIVLSLSLLVAVADRSFSVKGASAFDLRVMDYVSSVLQKEFSEASMGVDEAFWESFHKNEVV